MTSRGRPPHPDILTPREWEVLSLLRERLSNEQIAQRLGITERTVRFHVSEILSKLGFSSREQAAVWNPQEGKPWWTTAFHWPLKWSIVAKIAGLGAVAATAGGIGILVLGVAVTDSPPFGDDADPVIQQAASAAGKALVVSGDTVRTLPEGYEQLPMYHYSFVTGEPPRQVNISSSDPLPEECVPLDLSRYGNGTTLRSQLGYPIETPTCLAQGEKPGGSHVRCHAVQHTIGVIDEEEISRICLSTRSRGDLVPSPPPPYRSP